MVFVPLLRCGSPFSLVLAQMGTHSPTAVTWKSLIQQQFCKREEYSFSVLNLSKIFSEMQKGTDNK